MKRPAHDAAAARHDDIPAGNGLLGPIGARHQHVGLKKRDERVRAILAEDDHGVDAVESGENLGTLAFGVDRAGGPFDCADRAVGTHSNDQRVAEAAGVLQLPQMPGVQQVEHACGEHDTPGFGAQPIDIRARLDSRQDRHDYRDRRATGGPAKPGSRGGP